MIIVQLDPCGSVPWVSWTELLAGSTALASQSRPFPSESKPPLAAVSAGASSSLRPREARIQSGVTATAISCKQSRGSNSAGSGSSNGIKDLIGSQFERRCKAGAEGRLDVLRLQYQRAHYLHTRWKLVMRFIQYRTATTTPAGWYDRPVALNDDLLIHAEALISSTLMG